MREAVHKVRRPNEHRATQAGGRAVDRGGLAQLGEHLLCKQRVVGSIPSSSTTEETNSCSCDRDEGPGNRFFMCVTSTLIFNKVEETRARLHLAIMA